MPVARHFVRCFQPTAVEISRGKTRYFRCASAGFTKYIPNPQMEDFAVTCPLVPDAPRLISGSCSSPRSFGFSFLQTLPRGNALAVLLAFGSAKTWLPDLHRHSYVPCPAHTFEFTGAARLYRAASGGTMGWATSASDFGTEGKHIVSNGNWSARFL